MSKNDLNPDGDSSLSDIRTQAMEKWILHLEDLGFEPQFTASAIETSEYLKSMVDELTDGDETDEDIENLCIFCILSWNLSGIKIVSEKDYSDTLDEIVSEFNEDDTEVALEMKEMVEDLVDLKLEMYPEQIYNIDPSTLQINSKKGKLIAIFVSPAEENLEA